MSFVTARNIFQSYGRRPILERVNVEVDEGEFISIVGASGCGKSTFLRLLLAQERPTQGEQEGNCAVVYRPEGRGHHGAASGTTRGRAIRRASRRSSSPRDSATRR